MGRPALSAAAAASPVPGTSDQTRQQWYYPGNTNPQTEM